MIDTQYQRTGDNYQSYSIFYNQSKKTWLIEIVTSDPVKNIDAVKLINCEKESKLKGSLSRTFNQVDNPNWQTFSFTVEQRNINVNDNANCNKYLKFITADSKYTFQLTLNHLLLKKEISN